MEELKDAEKNGTAPSKFFSRFQSTLTLGPDGSLVNSDPIGSAEYVDIFPMENKTGVAVHDAEEAVIIGYPKDVTDTSKYDIVLARFDGENKTAHLCNASFDKDGIHYSGMLGSFVILYAPKLSTPTNTPEPTKTPAPTAVPQPTVTPTPTAKPTASPSHKPGDVTGDGKITSADALQIQRYVVQRDSMLKNNANAQKAADVTGDGKVTSADALQIQRYVVKRPSVLDKLLK